MGIQVFPKQEGIYTKLSKTNLSISIHLSICAGVLKIHLGDENMISASCLGEKQKATVMCLSKYGILIAMPLVGEIPKPPDDRKRHSQVGLYSALRPPSRPGDCKSTRRKPAGDFIGRALTGAT